MHFDADKLPPAFAFWSVTMYDAEGFQVAQSNSTASPSVTVTPELRRDGSLDLYFSTPPRPADARRTGCPRPLGPLGVTMRLYAPKREVLTGQWHPPPVHKA